jgi:hypothetical protein
VTFTGASDPTLVYAGSRTSTPNRNVAVGGSFGTFQPALLTGTAVANETWVYGLREDADFRSNLALVHSPAVPGSAGAPIGVEVQLFDGETGQPSGSAVSYLLRPGEFKQWNAVLKLGAPGLSNGYAHVRITSGSDRAIVYGVVNDGATGGGGTSDGSILQAGGAQGLVPVVLDVPGTTHFQTELTLTNPSAVPATVQVTYTPSSVFAPGGGGTVSTLLEAGRQLQVPGAIAFLRGLGLPIPDDGLSHGGTLLVTGAVAQARTFNPNPDTTVGGTFGVSYPAVDASARAKTAALVYGLRQDADARSNLAIADARTSGGDMDYVIELFDVDTGAADPVSTLHTSLGPGQWFQFGSVLAQAGIAHGYARVTPSGGASDFVVYGVVNDGPTPGSRTSDGSYLPMVVLN